jgi:hypothetical protein
MIWLGPVVAGAQIASVVPPPGARRAPARPAAYDTAPAQTRHPTTQLTGLTAWVDSAVAANASTRDVPAAPSAAPPDAGRIATSRLASAPVAASSRFYDGAIAPDTASPLPEIALAGLLALGIGLVVNHRARKRV